MAENRYDKSDMIRREAMIRAGAIKIASYRVRDVESGEFGPLQIHFTYDNTVMAVLSESSAKLLHNFVEKHVIEGDDK